MHNHHNIPSFPSALATIGTRTVTKTKTAKFPRKSAKSLTIVGRSKNATFARQFPLSNDNFKRRQAVEFMACYLCKYRADNPHAKKSYYSCEARV